MHEPIHECAIRAIPGARDSVRHDGVEFREICGTHRKRVAVQRPFHAHGVALAVRDHAGHRAPIPVSWRVCFTIFAFSEIVPMRKRPRAKKI